MAFNDGIKAAPIAYIGSVSVIVTLVSVLMLQVLYFQQRHDRVSADLATQNAPAELAELTSKQLTLLTERKVVDREQGIVTIGIDRAMELVVSDLSQGKSPRDVIGPNLLRTTDGGENAKTEKDEANGDSVKVDPNHPPAATQEKKDDEQS